MFCGIRFNYTIYISFLFIRNMSLVGSRILCSSVINNPAINNYDNDKESFASSR